MDESSIHGALEVWNVASEALSHIGKAAIDPLVDRLRRADSTLRWRILLTIEDMSDEVAIEHLIMFLDSPQGSESKRAARELAKRTQIDLGGSKEEWERWWTENRSTYVIEDESRAQGEKPFRHSLW